MPITRRHVLGGLALSGAGVLAASVAKTIRQRAVVDQKFDHISSDLSEMLMLGFDGTTLASNSARILADHIAAGRVGGVFFVRPNVRSRDDVLELVRFFFSRAPSPLLMAIDHEGGAVQRLTERHGFTKLPSARAVAENLSPEEAKQLYAKAGGELSGVGFNVNLAPVVDLHDATNPAVGQYGRSFGSDSATVITYAEAFIDGFNGSGVLCALKHFPGQGLARSDSHSELPDITSTWTEQELAPYAQLIKNGRAELIMGAHLRLATVEKEPIPTTLSLAVTTGLLRGKLGFQGVVMTDDLDMVAVSSVMVRREAVIRAIAAGNDILMIKNATYFDPYLPYFDPYLPQNVASWVRDAIDQGSLLEKNIAESADRIRRFKRGLANAWTNGVRNRESEVL
jgi:beta-N-acetylhexosaminidase